MKEPFAYCADHLRETNRDRYLATLFAPAEKREALFALYAFDAEIARVRDLAREMMPGEIRLQWWREVLLGERAGEAAANPVAAAMAEILECSEFVRDPLVDLIEAHRFDVQNAPMESVDALETHAARTDGTIVELAVRLVGGKIESTVAHESGSALTIANLLSQFPRHAARRQLYVPLDILRHYGAGPEDVFAMRSTPELRAALAELRLRARRNLAHVVAVKIPELAKPAFLPLAPLRQWLVDMERPGYDPFRPPVVSPWRRQWRIWRAAKSFQRIGA
ncbi:MAG TPA: squalene/phytoene synthase family protein [Pseudolabrys sp.]|jgi:phytoene synthase|nr:squalene/phytoene synthase family protein [Pseudolabrys sp.]